MCSNRILDTIDTSSIMITWSSDTLKEETFTADDVFMKIFTRIICHGERLSKDFTAIKKGESKFVNRNVSFYCTVLRWDTWPVLKSPKKRFLKKLFSTISWVLIFWNHLGLSKLPSIDPFHEISQIMERNVFEPAHRLICDLTEENIAIGYSMGTISRRGQQTSIYSRE